MEVATSLPIQLIQPPSSTILADNTYQRSWSLGNYRITNPTTSSDCGSKKNDLSQCPSQFTAYNTLLLLTVMSTPTISRQPLPMECCDGWDGRNNHFWSGNSSICPKGWKLPESNATTAGTFSGLINAYSVGSDVAKLTSSPLYFVRGGDVSQSTSYLFISAGDDRLLLVIYSKLYGSSAYNLNFTVTSCISPSSGYNRHYGLSVRCLAR